MNGSVPVFGIACISCPNGSWLVSGGYAVDFNTVNNMIPFNVAVNAPTTDLNAWGVQILSENGEVAFTVFAVCERFVNP